MSNHVWYHWADFDTRFIMIKTLCMLLDYYVMYVSKKQPFNRTELVIVALGQTFFCIYLQNKHKC